MPSLPKLPSIIPLRRIDVPDDLGSVTTIAEEAPPALGGLDQETVESLWEAATDLYRSGIHPALQLCLRRNGEVVLDRSIGHMSGNGPDDDDDAENALATPETPFCVYSTSKAVTAVVVHL